MARLALPLVLAAVLGGLAGCHAGGPNRASDVQNLNAISDDISAVTMTQSDRRHAEDPNIRSTLPHHYEVSDIR